MAQNHRRMAGMAVGAILAAPLIALLASPLASADPADPALVVTNPDVTTTDYSLFGFTEAYSSNSDTGGADSLLTLGSDDLDVFDSPPDTYGFLFTDGTDAQFGIEVVDGKLELIDNVPPATFIDPDPGLADISAGGVVSGEALAGLDGLFGF